MKILGLLRHAKSDWDDVGKRDFDRDLNDRGRKGARLMGEHIHDQGQHWDLVLASPAARAKQTLEEAMPDTPVKWDERLYLADPATIMDVLHELVGDIEAVLVVGHNPGLQEMLFELVPSEAECKDFDEAATKYPTAAFSVFELGVDDWAKVGRNCGRLVHFKRPRDLDPSLGPEE